MREKGPGCPRLSPWHLVLKHFCTMPSTPHIRQLFPLEPIPDPTRRSWVDRPEHISLLISLRSCLVSFTLKPDSWPLWARDNRALLWPPSEVCSRDWSFWPPLPKQEGSTSFYVTVVWEGLESPLP